MRKYLRYRAHANMKALGMAHVNRKYRIGKETGRSFFARAWRKYAGGVNRKGTCWLCRRRRYVATYSVPKKKP